MIIDAFCFYGEFPLLELRLMELDRVVDYFIILDITKSMVNNILSSEKFIKYKKKIIHSVPYSDNEFLQRDGIKTVLDNLKLNPEDIIIISDIDEIPNINILENIKTESIKLSEIKSLEMDMYLYNFNNKTNYKWYFPKILPFKYIKNLSIQQIRTGSYPFIENSGWYLAFFQDPVKKIAIACQNSRAFVPNMDKVHIKYTYKDHILAMITNFGFFKSMIGLEKWEINNNLLPKNYNLIHTEQSSDISPE